MRRILTPVSVVLFFFGILLDTLINLIANRASNAGNQIVTILVILFVISGGTIIILKIRSSHIITRMSPPIAMRNPPEIIRNARKGMIAFVSLYNPIKDSTYKDLSRKEQEKKMDEFRKAAKELDYSRLNFEQSNLEPLIKAIVTHRSKLQHCWLIATAGERGSQLYVPVLIKYLREQKGFAERNGDFGCEFHFGDKYQISLDRVSETQVVDDTHKLVESIFTEAHGSTLQLADNEIIADITSGPRSMPLGMILACLDCQRDIQFTGTEYDPIVTPTGEPVPIIFNFEPQFLDS